MPIKACLHCGGVVNKKINHSKKMWDERAKFCSKQCKYQYPMSEAQKAKISKTLMGHSYSPKWDNSPKWQGDNIKYPQKHWRMYQRFGKADHCDFCATLDAKRYEWASINHVYSLNRDDWLILCVSCHRKLDRFMGLVLKGLLNTVISKS